MLQIPQGMRDRYGVDDRVFFRLRVLIETAENVTEHLKMRAVGDDTAHDDGPVETHDLHGRPGISGFGALTFVAVLALVAWGLRRVIVGQPGWFSFFAISAVAIWEGVQLIPTLRDGFVLAAVPPLVARTACVVCLGCGLGLLLLVFRLAERREREEMQPGDAASEFDGEDLGAYA